MGRERKRLMRWEKKCPHVLARVCDRCGCPDLPALTEYRREDLSERIQRKLLQKHHVAREKADDTIIVLCRNCHAVLDDLQYDWPPDVREPRSREERIAALLAGAEDLVRCRAEADLRLADRLHEIQEELRAIAGRTEQGGRS
jgi:hypothetical protein